LPQVASARPTLPQQPEPAGRASTSDKGSDAFGAMLDGASAEPATAVAGPGQLSKTAGADKSKPQNKSAPSADAAPPTQTAGRDITPGAVPQTASASGLHLAILAQTASAPSEVASLGVPSKKTDEPGEDIGQSDAKSYAGNSATSSPVTADVQIAAVPAASVIAAPTPAAVQTGGENTSSIPSTTVPVSAQSILPSQSALQGSTATPTAETDSDLTPKADPTDMGAAATQSAGAAIETDGASAAPTKVSASTATVADAQVSPLAAGSTSGPAKASKAQISDTTSVEKPSMPAADAQVDSPKTEGKKVGGSKDSSSKAQAGTIKESSTASLKPVQPQPSSDERVAVQQASAENSGTPAPHQAHEQASEHAAASTRVASAVAHTDISASLTQPFTTQTGPSPSALGLTVAAPLASPVQTIFQPTPERPDGSDKAVPISGVAVEIVSRAEDGLRRFEIRLDPPELGRIDVRLDVDNGGNVRSRLTVDRPETLDLLRRDAPQLERALQHAGLNTEGGLQFSLRDQNFANRDQSPRNTPTFIVPDDEAAAADAARRGYGRLVGLGSGVDIRV
jgi:flagellar hook-length control protein FliK